MHANLRLWTLAGPFLIAKIINFMEGNKAH